MECKFKLKECENIDDAIKTLRSTTRYIVEDLYYKQSQTEELIRFSDRDRKSALDNIQKSQKDLKKMFDECGCVAEPIKGGLAEAFGKTTIKSKY